MPDGSCPKCRSVLDDGSHDHAGADAVESATSGDEAAAAQEAYKIPWHFWVMVAATVFYLGWRAWQGIDSLF